MTNDKAGNLREPWAERRRGGYPLRRAPDQVRDNNEDYKWRTQRRDVYYGYGNSGYPYCGVWKQTYWYGY